MRKIISTILSVVMTLSLVLGNAAPVQAVQATDRVQQLLSQMTLEQKVGQMLQPDTRSITPEEVAQYYIGSILSGGGASPSTGNTAADWAARADEYQKAAIEGFGIPLLYGVDAVHGHNNVTDAVMFPHNVGLGQSGNADLVQQIGEITAKEVRATGANWTFTPTLGLPTNERWGRTYECYGENAELSALLGAAYITGSQGAFADYNAIATAKHFVGEGITTDGVNQGNVPLDYDSEEFQTILYEELLTPYKSAIAAGVKSVMVSYNSIGGEKCHGNQALLTGVLKNELGFDGIVISDYNGVDQIEGNLTYAQKVQQAVNAGIDMLMVDGTEGSVAKWRAARQAVIDGVNSGAISIDRINDAVTRILNVKDEMGLLENPASAYSNQELLAEFGSDAHKAVARQAVSESLTLLKNTATQNGTSTIMQDLASMDNIVVAGSSANDIGMQCGGWTIWWQGFSGSYTSGTTIYEGLKEVAGSGKTIDLSVDGTFTSDNYDAAIVVVGEAPYAESAGDRAAADLKLSDTDIEIINTISENHPDLPIIAVLTTGRPITIANQIDQFDAVIMAGFPGSEGAGVADVLLGEQDFTGHLTYTWPWYAQDIEEKFTDSSKVLFAYGRGLTKAETTAIATEKPEDPTMVDLGETNGVLEAESYASASSGVVLENDGTTVGYFWAGRELVYKVNVPESGIYNITMSTATNNASVDVAMDIYVDGTLAGSVSKELTSTGGWAVFADMDLGIELELLSGTHTLTFVSQSQDFNIDWFTFTKTGDVEGGTIVDLGETDGVLEAESYYTKHADVVLENDGTTVGYFWENRDIVYKVNVPESGTYKMIMSAATDNASVDVAMNIYVDDALAATVSQTLSSTGGWAVFEDMELNPELELTEGVHTIQFVSLSRDFNIDRFTFVKTGDLEDSGDSGNTGGNTGGDTVVGEGQVQVSMSSSENSQSQTWYQYEQTIENKNTEKDPLNLYAADNSSMTTITVDDNTQYQPVLGIGISMEESTVNNLLKMSESARKAFIKNLVDPENGMGVTLIRVTIGTADFTGQEFYTYYDGTGTELNGEPDWYNETGSGFSIQKDIDYGIIGVLQEIIAAAEEVGTADELKFFASSWTPPGWMKTATSSSNSYANNDKLLKGGRLNSDYIEELAKYYVRFVEEYQKQGIPIYAMTLQNEPLLEINYPSCAMTGSQQALLAKAVKEAFANSTILSENEKDVKVWAFDHNFDGAQAFVNELFGTADGRDNVDGIAFHPYGGSATSMGALYDTYAGTYTMQLTERSVWGTSGANDIITWFRNGSESYNSWVTMLDSNISPHQWVGTPDPTLFVKDADSQDGFWCTPEVYITGQFTKYIRPGYVRIDSTEGSSSTINNVAFQNPDTGEIVLVVTNCSGRDQTFKVVLNGTQFTATLPAGNVATYHWTPVTAEDILSVAETIPYGTETVELTLEAGTFLDALEGKVTLEGDAAEYVTVASAAKKDDVTAVVTLAWNPIYAEAVSGTFCVAADAYEGGVLPLSADTLFGATDAEPEAIAVGTESVALSEDLAYRSEGTLTTEGGKGNYVDFYLDVAEAGEYTISFDVTTSEAVANGLKISGGAGYTTEELETISLAKFWGNTVEYRSCVTLEAGKQTLRLEKNAGDTGFVITNIAIQAVSYTKIGSEPVTIGADLTAGGSADVDWAIEVKDEIADIGYQTSGSYQDYYVNVKTPGTYTFQIQAGGSSEGTPTAILQLVENGTATDLGSAAAPVTGSWDTFADSDAAEVTLTSGKQILRIYNDAAGFNYRSFTLTLKESSLVEPSKVTGVTAVYENGQIQLIWDDNGADMYKVVRSDGRSGYMNLTYKATAAGWTDTKDLVDAQLYYYRVIGYFKDADGNLVMGEMSDAAAVVATDGIPAKISNVSSTVSGGNVTLTWDKAEHARYYKVSRAAGATGKYYTMKYNIETTSYSESSVAANLYRYKVAGYYKDVDGSWVYGDLSDTLYVTVK